MANAIQYLQTDSTEFEQMNNNNLLETLYFNSSGDVNPINLYTLN